MRPYKVKDINALEKINRKAARFVNRRSEDTNRQKEVNGKPEGFRMKNKNPIVEVITKYKYRNESNKAKRTKIN